MAVASKILLHDKRLKGSLGFASYTFPDVIPFSINEKSSLRTVFKGLADFAGTFDNTKQLDIYCHGYESQTPKYGGLGLQLGKDDLLPSNVNDLGLLLWGQFHRIVIYACSAADSSYAKIDPAADGQKLMQSLADSSGAEVVAADATQYYYPIPIAGIYQEDGMGRFIISSPGRFRYFNGSINIIYAFCRCRVLVRRCD